ncbi:MAG: DUF3293 domain-containing protein [Janthinobacterium lividum]
MTGLVPPTPAVLRAYRLSTYTAGGIVAHVGHRPDQIPPRWAGRDLMLLSACNPCGRLRPDGWNQRMMGHLREALRGFSCAEGEGRLGRWSEPLLLVAIAPARGIRLARLFRQNAVVLLRDRRPARLVLLATMAIGHDCPGAS